MTSVAADSSGNGNDGVYLGLAPPNGRALFVGTNVSSPGPIDLSGDWTAEGWFRNDEPGGSSGPLWSATFAGLALDAAISVNTVTGAAAVQWNMVAGVGNEWRYLCPAGTVPNDGIGHYWAVTVIGDVATFYLDGIPQTTTLNITGTSESPTMAHLWTGGGGGGGTPGDPIHVAGLVSSDLGITNRLFGAQAWTFDEYAFYNAGLSAPDIAAHFAARGSFAEYAAAVLADSPSGYWHLNDVDAASGWYVGSTAMRGG